MNGSRRQRASAAGWFLVLAACGPVAVTLSPVPSVAPTPIPAPTATPDLEPPRIVARDPGAGGTAPLVAAIRVWFSEPVVGVDDAQFQMRDADGGIVEATVALEQGGRVAVLTPAAPLTLAATYALGLAGSIRDSSGNRLAPTAWQIVASRQVTFAAGRYTGYLFGGAPNQLIDLRRATLEQPSSAEAAEYREIGGQGYLLIQSGIWEGLWVHGVAGGAATDDAAAPLIPLPACAYLDLPTARPAESSWASTVLDTVFRLPAEYHPDDLRDTSAAGLNAGHRIRGVAIHDLAAMVEAASVAGARLAVQSAYRSYASQVVTFNGWVSQVGYAEALTVSARPGHSEHQLGTAIDFRSAGGPSPWRLADWATTPEGGWMAANAWRFGWVMSYPRETADRTCYAYEPWHYRYVGRPTAAAMHDSGLTPREWLWAQGHGVR